jgi:hypothetical protein
MYFFYASIILDIFCLNEGQTAVKNPFTVLNTSFIKTINGKVNSFLNDTEPVQNPDDEEKVDHYLKVTLLPHQIIIFPKTIFDNMDGEVLLQMRYYTDPELR